MAEDHLILNLVFKRCGPFVCHRNPPQASRLRNKKKKTSLANAFPGVLYFTANKYSHQTVFIPLFTAYSLPIFIIVVISISFVNNYNR